MTAPLLADLTEHEFSISCEAPNCDEPAAVMCQGCSDPQHIALCGRHLADLEQSFEACKPATCSTCYRPFMHFETHFSLESL